jgi:hypothetical protein
MEAEMNLISKSSFFGSIHIGGFRENNDLQASKEVTPKLNTFASLSIWQIVEKFGRFS